MVQLGSLSHRNKRGDVAGVITYQQTVTGIPLKYNCGVVWDEHQPLVTVLRIDGLRQKQVDLLTSGSLTLARL